MDEASLVRTAPRTFEYRETTHVVENDKPRNLVAKVHVQMVALAHLPLAALQPATKDTEKARPHTVVVWRLSTFETSVIPRMFLDLAKKGQKLQKAP